MEMASSVQGKRAQVEMFTELKPHFTESFHNFILFFDSVGCNPPSAVGVAQTAGSLDLGNPYILLNP